MGHSINKHYAAKEKFWHDLLYDKKINCKVTNAGKHSLFGGRGRE